MNKYFCQELKIFIDNTSRICYSIHKRFVATGVFMARLPKKVEDSAVVDRVIPISGWVYNLMIELADEQHRDVKSQVVYELEQVSRKLRKEREKAEKPGNMAPAPINV